MCCISCIVGSNSGQPLRSVAKRDGVAGAGSHHHTKSTRRSRVSEGGEGERERGRGRERLLENRKQEGRDTRREAGGLSGQMNKNREVHTLHAHSVSLLYLYPPLSNLFMTALQLSAIKIH